MNNSAYPRIAEDYALTFRTLKSLPCDIFLGAHGAYFDMQAKITRMGPGQPNPFIDPAGYKAYVEEREQTFTKELAKQTKGRLVISEWRQTPYCIRLSSDRSLSSRSTA